MADTPVPLIAKMSIQEKVAELERRIAAIEKTHRVTTTTTTRTVAQVDLEPELGSIWKNFDALFAKVFKS